MIRLALVPIGIAALAAAPSAQGQTPLLPHAGTGFDYQIGGDYPLPSGVRVVSRDWFSGKSPRTGYGICYVNAFQTQADEPGVDRPDERSNWPANLVLTRLGDDPNWGGEYLVDISTSAKRAAAARHLKPMITRCRRKGFRAVEFDNLDSWTRFDGTPLGKLVPFGRAEAIDFARRVTVLAHQAGLAAAQKNTVELRRRVSRKVIGFDFAISESCGRFDECADYRAAFGNLVFDIEYDAAGMAKACRSIGARASVVRRDRNVSRPDSASYRYGRC